MKTLNIIFEPNRKKLQHSERNLTVEREKVKTIENRVRK